MSLRTEKTGLMRSTCKGDGGSTAAGADIQLEGSSALAFDSGRCIQIIGQVYL